MPPISQRKPGGFAALYEVQEKLRRDREDSAKEHSEPAEHPQNTEPKTSTYTTTKQLEDRQLAESSQPTQSSQPAQSSQPVQSGQLYQSVSGSSTGSQLAESSQLSQSSQPLTTPQVQMDLLAGLPPVKGHLRLPNQILDHLLPILDPFEQAVYIQLYRLSWGFNKPSCNISLPKLSGRTRVPLSTLKKVLGRLQSKRLIEKAGLTIGYGKEQGVEYRVLAGSSQLAESSQPTQSSQLAASYNKRKEHTNTHTHRDASPQSDNKSSIAPAGVSVGSKFTLEECLSYAKHMKETGQGIERPGGYATIIHRSGEADALIEKFLNPPAPPTSVDATACPDCRGTGWWYPKGPEMGIAKCKHARLASNVLGSAS